MPRRVPAAERRLRLVTPTGPTDVVIGHGLVGRVEALVADAAPRARRRLYVVDGGVASARVHGRWAGEWAMRFEGILSQLERRRRESGWERARAHYEQFFRAIACA